MAERWHEPRETDEDCTVNKEVDLPTCCANKRWEIDHCVGANLRGLLQ
ncbi:Hypothetical protein CpCap5W_0762 [Corynebacterium pseudotuberculosis]|nr:Hypothetical protein CpCap5W_0762 [Corynebacterium pseudotuberculosis]QDL44849.1 hypothetical protein CpCAPGE03_0766 [Corynebacterium pseudotuberculosis]